MWVMVVVASLLFAWSVLSGRVERLDVTGPIVFLVFGVVLGSGAFPSLRVSVETSAVHHLAEVTLALVLFADAARVDPKDLRRHSGLPTRLLAIGLPLTVVAGSAVAVLVFTDLPWQLAALVGAALAPTDAALSTGVLADDAVPFGVRRSLNVESGLNDGIATPVVTGLIAASTAVVSGAAPVASASTSLGGAVVDLLGGAAIGLAIGYLGGLAIVRSRAVGWSDATAGRVAVLMVAVVAFALSLELGCNQFVAAFVAGLGFRTAPRDPDDEATELPDLIGRVLSLTVWFIFGAALVVDAIGAVDWRIVLYASLSLTVVRMAPVALAMIGTGADRATTLFVGWFGPRGLASVVFGLLIVEELPIADAHVQLVSAVVVVTVVASVLLHGASGRPLARRMARRAAPAERGPEARP